MKQLFFFLIIFGFQYTSTAQENTNIDGDISNESFYLEFSIYSIGDPIDSKTLQAEFTEAFTDLKTLKTPPDNITENTCAYFHYDNAQKDYPSASLEHLNFLAGGLNDRQKQLLAKSKQVSVFLLFGLKKDTWAINKRIVKWLGEICKGKKWIIYDGETRQYFDPVEWEKIRVQTWSEEIPYLASHLTIHSYREEEFCRCITLGMQKFGLPDIVINNASCYSVEDHQNLINVMAQMLTTNQNIYKGQYLIDLNKIPNKDLRTEALSSLQDNAKKKAILQIKKGKNEEGDPYNNLIEIDFENKNYESPQVYQEQLISDIFGYTDPVYTVSHNEAIQKASNEARAKLPELQKLFNKGLENSSILLKAPFEDDEGGTEWIWVEVTDWKTSKIKGILQNEPFGIKNLKAGAVVGVNQEDIFDYIYYLPDGSMEGNKTNELILKYKDD